jgi:RimJ/RimL family protein N-acetyltransferase
MKVKPGRQSGVFLSGKLIDLVVLTEDDVLNSDWYDWFNDEQICRKLQKHYYPNTREKQLEFLKQINSDPGKIQLGIKPKNEDNLIGVISLQGIDFINRNAEIAMVMALADDDARQLIFSLEATRLMLEHGFFTLNLHRIYAGSLSLLKPWLMILKTKFGFIDEGVMHEHAFKDNKYVDVFRVGLLKADFEKALEKYGD